MLDSSSAFHQTNLTDNSSSTGVADSGDENRARCLELRSKSSRFSTTPTTYWYEGRCPKSGEWLRLPRTQLIEAIAQDLMQQLATDTTYSREGKMYGVLLVETPTGEQQVLKAFSGLLSGNGTLAGWVPPIPGRDHVALQEAHTLASLEAMKQELIALQHLSERDQFATVSQEFETRLQDLALRHHQRKQERHHQRQVVLETLTGEALQLAIAQLDEQSRQDGIERRHLKRQRDAVLQPLKCAIEQSDTRIRELKHQRKALSRQLQAEMHATYWLTNVAGESLPLQDLMPAGVMPTGTGDCCAPKLLHYAATHHLTPLAMAEFWWGPSSTKGDKLQGKFYAACAERCQPLMGFLLSGLSAPLPHTSHEELVPTSKELGRSDPDWVYRGFLHFVVNPFGGGLGEAGRPPDRGGWGAAPQASGFATTVSSQDFETTLPISTYQGELTLPILYEDEWLIAVNKPAGLLSVPGRYRDRQDSVLSRLRHLLPDGATLTAVHRLDQDTSGILLLARNQQTYRHLSQQFQQRQVHKVYEAVLNGCVQPENGLIELPLWGNPCDRPYQTVDWQRGKPSLTQFQVIAREGDYTRMEFVPLTGRTHQIRVHAADWRGIGVPILGDRWYGCQTTAYRLHLHARELHFEHPQVRKTLHLRTETSF